MILAIASSEDVDDDLAEALRARGQRVTSHRCGVSGLQAALNEAPDLVLLGMGLPDLADESRAGLAKSIQHGIYQGFVAPVALFAVFGAVMWRNRRAQEKAGEVKP